MIWFRFPIDCEPEGRAQAGYREMESGMYMAVWGGQQRSANQKAEF